MWWVGRCGFIKQTMHPCCHLDVDIAELAEKNQQVLVPDEGAQYDQLIEIDLSTVRQPHLYYMRTSMSCVLVSLQLEPLVNGPFTPDLANPISQLGKNAREKGWPTEIKVGKC